MIKKVKKHTTGITIKLPFLSLSVQPADVEKSVARELLVRLTDKRVLNSKECCDNCIRNSLESLQNIRKTLVDLQVKLVDYHDSTLYFLIEFMAEGIRQFVTFEEELRAKISDPKNDRNTQKQYFEILEQLRCHIYSCLTQVSILAEMESPKIKSYLESKGDWTLSLYKKPENLLTE